MITTTATITMTITHKNCHHIELLNILKDFQGKIEKDGAKVSVESRELTIDEIKKLNESEIKF